MNYTENTQRPCRTRFGDCLIVAILKLNRLLTEPAHATLALLDVDYPRNTLYFLKNRFAQEITPPKTNVKVQAASENYKKSKLKSKTPILNWNNESFFFPELECLFCWHMTYQVFCFVVWLKYTNNKLVTCSKSVDVDFVVAKDNKAC